MRKSIITPILFMVFNRPEKTQYVFDVIKSVKPTKLYVAADAPRDFVASDQNNCSKVRAIVRQIDWECEVKYLFHKNNLGGPLAGKEAWQWIFSQEKEMIFIEDDGLISKSFFWFCQELLKKYRNNPKVALIGGVNYGSTQGDATYFFSRFCSGTYAMATWKRIYDLYEFKLDTFLEIRNKKEFYQNFLNYFVYKYMTLRWAQIVSTGKYNYDSPFNYLVHKYDLINIIPNINLRTNIGFDLDGQHACDQNDELAINFGNRPRYELDAIIHPNKIEVDRDFEIKYFKVRWLQGKPWWRVFLNYYGGPIYRTLYKKPLKYFGIE